MAAYMIIDVEVRDPERYKEYVKMVPPTLEPFGGRFLVRGGHAENVEGDWQPKRIVVVEFESIERAREWWDSDMYQPAKQLRQSASVGHMIFVEGV